MNVNPSRGAKTGALTAVGFATVAPINNLLHHEAVDVSRLLVGSAFAFIVFGLIGTFSAKIGTEVGDQ